MVRTIQVVASVAISALVVAAAAPGEARRGTAVRVTMTHKACVTAPKIVEPGTVAVTIVNRTRRRRLFTIAGHRSRCVQPRRNATLAVGLARAGLYR